jgi:hypothetical protein
VTTWTAAAIVGTTVTYNTVKQATQEVKLNEAALTKDTVSLVVDRLQGDSLYGNNSISQSDTTTDILSSQTGINNNQETDLTVAKENSTSLFENNDNTTLSETFKSFQIIHGSKYLDRNSGLSV